MTATELFRICVVKQFGHDPRRDHVHFSFGGSAPDEPLLQLGGDGRDVIRENWNKPIQSVRDCVGEPGRTNEAVTGQLVGHQVDGIVKQWAAGDPFCHHADQRAFIVVRVNNIDAFVLNHATKQPQKG